MELSDLITVYSGETPPDLKQRGYLDEWKWFDFVVTPLTIFKIGYSTIVGLGGKQLAISAVPEGSAEFVSLRLPAGHPQEKSLYERHDADPSRFVLPSSKDALQLSEQLHAYTAALGALGAKSAIVTVERDDSSTGRIDLKAAGDTANFNVRTSDTAKSHARVEVHFPGHGPRPMGDSPWLQVPEWQDLEQMRVQDGLTSYEFSFSFQASKNRSFDAGVAEAVRQMDLNIHGQFESLGSSEFSIIATF